MTFTKMEPNKQESSSKPAPKKAPKTPPAKRKPRTSKLSQDQMLIILKKKRECNARAQKIVEELLDPVAPEKLDDFLANLVHISQSHYEDIVEERSITKLCGYPLCDVRLGDAPKQQYKISMVHNKVYDITDRKSFCSNKCYKCSLYLKEQILSTPLWVREEENEIPEFKLLTISPDQKEQNEVGDSVKFPTTECKDQATDVGDE